MEKIKGLEKREDMQERVMVFEEELEELSENSSKGIAKVKLECMENSFLMEERMTVLEDLNLITKVDTL